MSETTQTEKVEPLYYEKFEGKYYASDFTIRRTHDGTPVASTQGGTEEDEAWARLFTRAPELRAFLEDFVTAGCHHACADGHCSHQGNLRMKWAKLLLAKLAPTD